MCLNSSCSYYFRQVLFHTILNVILKDHFKSEIITHHYSLSTKIFSGEKLSPLYFKKTPINFQIK